MQTLIYRKPIFRFPPHLLSSNCTFAQTDKNHDDFFRIHPKKCGYGFKTLTLCSAASPQSLGYGGWDNFQLIGDSVHSGQSNQFDNFLNSLGIGDKKYVFVYLFGFVCALAVSRVKVSSIVVFPACAIVFALGFSIGLVKGGHLKELRLNGSRKKFIDDTGRGSIENFRNLGDNLKGYNAKVLELKNGIRRSIECNQVTVSDLESYIDVIESADVFSRNAIDFAESCIQSVLGGKQEKEGGSIHESGRRRKKSGEIGMNVSKYFGGLFGGKFDGSQPARMKDSGKMELMDVDVNDKKLENILIDPLKQRNMTSAPDGNLENKSASMSEIPFDSTSRARNRAEDFVDAAGMGNIAFDNDIRNVVEENDTAETVSDRTTYSYRNKTSRFVDNQRVYLKDYQDAIETSHNNTYNSVDVSISMNHIKTAASFGRQQKRETLNRNYLHLENTEEDQRESQRYSYKERTFSQRKRDSFANQESADEQISGSSASSILGDDLEFNRYVAEANNLLKEAKGCLIQQVDDGRAEHALHKSAILLSKAIDMRPMSLLAVGQLGNTYLLHGELKLRNESRIEINKVASALVNACEECETLLIKAGRKYKLALSIDGNDMRALYNWGLALSFRAQLIADIGPSAARDADKVFLAAIDKFDAMMSKSNVYALMHRSRLRPRHSREKIKLLQQARQLYEDALQMDSGNPQLQHALSSCISELEYWYS
ncbi:UNVERIFIED_CONTAM: hypothetical protein Slati_2004000 [Sesamum latifolium]|uniref:Uncharacterized protein n=1 Tax=Sesamum latifolium TaxID=2727402 RepID=A0AAW2WMQ7_9LAMI